MFRKKEDLEPREEVKSPQGRVTSLLGPESNWKGTLTGSGGVRIEGLFEGKINIKGLVVVDPNGRLESDLIQADTVIVAGAVRSDIKAKRVEIRSTGKVWGNVTTVRFSTEEGAYLRGNIQMEEELDPEAKAQPDDHGEDKIPSTEED